MNCTITFFADDDTDAALPDPIEGEKNSIVEIPTCHAARENTIGDPHTVTLHAGTKEKSEQVYPESRYIVDGWKIVGESATAGGMIILDRDIMLEPRFWEIVQEPSFELPGDGCVEWCNAYGGLIGYGGDKISVRHDIELYTASEALQ